MYQLIFCTCPDQKSAEELAGMLVSGKLAACVNILPNGTSIYEWQGKTEVAREHLLLVKSRKDCYAALEAAIKAAHPYQVPEIVAIAIEAGSAEYLQWMDSCLSKG